MQFLDINGVRRLKQYTDETYATKESVENNALVTSAALNDLNDRVSTIEDSTGDVEYATKQELDDNALVTSSALNDINDRLIIVESEAANHVTAEEYSVIESVVRDTYTKQEIDTMLADIDGGSADLTNYYTKSQSDARYAQGTIPTKISQLSNDVGVLTSESDPVFTASAAAGITSSDITNWNSKTSNTGTVTQVKVGTTAYNPSNGVVSLPAYPTSLPASDVSSWAKAATKPTYTASEVGAATQSDINSAISDLIGTAPEALNTLGEIADALNDDANLASTLTNQISAKYTKPSTGIPKTDLASDVKTSLGKADSSLQGVTFNGTTATVNNGIAAITATIPAAPGTLNTNNSTAQSTNASESLSGIVNLHKVSKTGSYNDLNDIPSAVTESTVSGWGFTKNTGTYSKPSNGIPKTDLTTDVQTSLGKADTALQSYTETDPTVPAWAKASTKPTYTASEVGALPDTTVIPAAANNSTITIQKGGTTVDSFTTNASAAKTINIPNELPSYSSNDSGKILSVNSSGQLVWITPAHIYSGTSAPDANTGNNGDVYLQE